MQIEIRFREILREHGLDKHGNLTEVAKFCKVHRHSVRKVVNNEATNPSMELLGKLCAWLVMKLPPEAVKDLPQRLFGAKPAELWRLITEARRAAIYLGEYHDVSQDPETSPNAIRWLSRRDVEVVGALTRGLSAASQIGEHQPVVVMRYVPVRYTVHAELPKQELQKDISFSTGVFKQMRREAEGDVSVIIGSQRVNHIIEHLVADLFGCEPFKKAQGDKPRVPFHLVYRGQERAVLSCFGGLKNPPGRRGPIKPGIYYLDRKSNWVHCPWESSRVDAGIIITSYDLGTKSLELAVLGFSGQGTEALGRELVKDCSPFWGKEVKSKGRAIGVYVCRFELTEQIVPDRGEAIAAKDMTVVALDAKVLRQYLR